MIPRGAAALRCTGDLRGMRAPQIKGCSMSRGAVLRTAHLEKYVHLAVMFCDGKHLRVGFAVRTRPALLAGTGRHRARADGLQWQNLLSSKGIDRSSTGGKCDGGGLHICL